ncbi:MAG: glycosyltransferase [Gelidibacter sp.]
MKLSVIIPVYNVEKYVGKCLDTVLDQNLDVKDYEVIIVNDGSTDDSLKIVQNYADINHHFKIIDKENGGAGSARNLGMDSAKGKYVYFIDPDDYLLTNCLNKLIETSEQHNLDILTFLSQSYCDTSLKSKSLFKKNAFSGSFGDNMITPIVNGEKYVAKVNYRSEVWWFLINREFLKATGLRFEEGRYLEDVAFSIALILEAKKIAHLQLDTHRYRVTPGSAMNSIEPNHYLKIIRDIQCAALAFNPIIKTLENKKANPDCIARVKARQQSLVFFSMIRMLKSTMSFEEVKLRMNEMIGINAYPLNSFLGKDYHGVKYQILVRLLNTERRFYFLFRFLNPVFKLRH